MTPLEEYSYVDNNKKESESVLVFCVIHFSSSTLFLRLYSLSLSLSPHVNQHIRNHPDGQRNEIGWVSLSHSTCCAITKY